MHVVLELFRKHSEFAFGDNLRYLAQLPSRMGQSLTAKQK